MSTKTFSNPVSIEISSGYPWDIRISTEPHLKLLYAKIWEDRDDILFWYYFDTILSQYWCNFAVNIEVRHLTLLSILAY